MSLSDMIEGAQQDSERWFPQTANNPFFIAACMAGEAGEVINLLKKVERGTHEYTPEMRAQVAEEVADVFTYLLHLCGSLDIDLESEYHSKRAANEIRFSARRNLTGPGHRAGGTVEIEDGHRTQIIPRLPREVLAEAGHSVGDVTQSWQTKGEFA